MVNVKLQLLVFLVLFQQCCCVDSQGLYLTIYYESKCPDSKYFILKQVQPAVQLLHDYLKLKFVPFGKARSINYGDGGFECQHGTTECLGNVVQDCSLHLMEQQSDLHKLAYVACEMDTQAGSMGSFDCVKRSNLSPQSVEECVTQGEGVVLQLESEYYTSLVKPSFIPTITINGAFNQTIQDHAQVDLIGTLCSMLGEIPPCARYYNYLALHHILPRTRYVK